MKKLAIVTDSASYLSKDYMKENNIFLLPLNIIFEKDTFEEITEITEQDFYKRLRVENSSTSQPTIGNTVSLFKRLKAEGYTDIYAVLCSSDLSGSYNSSLLAAELAGVEVISIDSRFGSYPMAQLITLIQNSFNKGLKKEDILSAVTVSIHNSHLYFIPSSLSQLKKSGRVSGSQVFLSSLLNIKLICGFEDGKVIMFDKTRSEKKAISYILNKLDKSISDSSKVIEEVAIIHCNAYEKAEILGNDLKLIYPNIKFIPTSLTAAVGVHAGENTIGLAWVEK